MEKPKGIELVLEILTIIFLAILLGNELNIFNLNSYQILYLIVSSGIFQLISFILKESEKGTFKETIDTLREDISSLKGSKEEESRKEEERVNSEKFYREQIENYDRAKEEDKVIRENIYELIRFGLISNDDVFNSLEDTDIYLVYCYANKPVKSTLLPKTRDYPSELQKMGFKRLPVRQSTYFITSDMLLKKYQNLYFLKKYVRGLILKSLRKEFLNWKNILKKSSNLGEKQKVFLSSNFESQMRANIMIFRSKINETNFDSINGVVLNEDILEPFAQHSIRYGLKISKEKKGHLIRFLKNISFESFLEGKEKEKLITYEREIRDKLGITSFLDYCSKNNEDIIKMISEYVSSDNAKVLAEQIILKSENYNNTLKKLKLVG